MSKDFKKPVIAVLKGLDFTLSAGYPFFIYYALTYWNHHQAVVFALVIILMRVLLNAFERKRSAWLKILPNAVVGLILILLSSMNQDSFYLLFYPVIVSSSLLAVFFGSLQSPPTVIERFARRSEGALNEGVVAYCRKVTVIWCFFFCFNICVSLGTIWSGNLLIWTWYNGLISYLLIGALLLGEWVYRLVYIKKKQESVGMSLDKDEGSCCT